MFPEVLSTGPMSLRMGQRSAALSLWVELADDGAVEGFGLESSWVRPAYRLSYADADELIELAPPQERYLSEIHGLMERRRRWRLDRGALDLDQPEGRIRCDDQGPQLEITEPSASRTMVAEAMILAGAVIASRPGAGPGPALPQPAGGGAAAGSGAAGPARRARAPRGHQALPQPGPARHQSGPHFSLGLPCYVQATSPIRRYNDLLVQRQLLAHQQGQPVLDEAELGALLSELEGRSARACRSPGRTSATGSRCGSRLRRSTSGRGCFCAGCGPRTGSGWCTSPIWPWTWPPNAMATPPRAMPSWCAFSRWIPCGTCCASRPRAEPGGLRD